MADTTCSIDTAQAGTIRFASESITLLSAAEIDAEADVETGGVVALTGPQVGLLALAAVRGRITLRVLVGAVTGSPSFTIDSLQYSIDGTNYRTWQSFAPISITAVGEKDGPEITVPLPGNAAKIRPQITVTTLDGSNKCPLTLQLRVEM